MKWYIIKALENLYKKGNVKKTTTLLQDEYINYLLNSTHELYETSQTIVKEPAFDTTYETYHLSKMTRYTAFLTEEGLLKPQIKFEDRDIEVLIDLRNLMISDELEELRTQIIDAKESLRGFSQMFFIHDKYLDDRPGLLSAVKKIIRVDSFPSEKDQQYLYVLHCHSPKAIVLCENLHFLKLPTLPRLNNIELWYAGGRNIDKLKYAPKTDLPIYYSCDWDYDGLDIFQAVHYKIPNIQLLNPNSSSKTITGTEHNSHWRERDNPELLSGLVQSLFSKEQRLTIKQLIVSDEWIIEEANDLIKMVDTCTNK